MCEQNVHFYRSKAVDWHPALPLVTALLQTPPAKPTGANHKGSEEERDRKQSKPKGEKCEHGYTKNSASL